MSDTIQKRKVSQEIISVLKDHSPLTLEMMQRMIEPPIQKKNIRQALGNLLKLPARHLKRYEMVF